MPQAVRRTYGPATHTRVLVSFFTDERNGLSIEEPVQAHPRLGYVTGFSSSKSLGAPSGTFSITLKKPDGERRSMLRALWKKPEDVWVRIKVQVDGQVIDTMLGLIDSVNEDNSRSGGGASSETYTISGRDIGKVLEQTELFVNLFHQPDNAVRAAGALTASLIERIIGTPEHFVRVLLEEWVGNNGTAEAQWVMPAGLGGRSFYSSLLDPAGRVRGIEAMNRTTNGEAVAPALFQIDQTGGKLWDVLQEYSNGVMNEMFVDLGPRQGASPRALSNLVPVFYFRERPFPTRRDDGRSTSRVKWNALRRHVLRPEDVKDRRIAKGGAATNYNYWVINVEGIGTEGFNVAEILQTGIDGVPYGQPGNIPIFNNESIQRHGLRRFMASTRFIPLSTTANGAEDGMFFRLVASWLKKLHDWYAPSPYHYSGQLVCSRIFPEIRIGQCAVEERAEGNITYYVESVAHQYQYPNAGSTTLLLTRGEYAGEDPLDEIYEQYANPRVLNEREMCFIDENTPLDEALDALRAGCRFGVPQQANVLGFTAQQSSLGAIEGDEFTVEGAAEQRALEIELGGEQPLPDDSPAILDPGMQRTLDDSEPSIGTAEEIPPPSPVPDSGQPTLDRGTLERGEPIPVPPEWQDPIAGISDDVGF